MSEPYRAHDDCCEHERLADLQSRLSAVEEENRWLKEELGTNAIHRHCFSPKKVADLMAAHRAGIERIEDMLRTLQYISNQSDWNEELAEIAADAVRRYEEGK